MHPLFSLAQTPPWEQPAAPPPPAPTQHGLTFSELKSGLRAYQSGTTRDSARTSWLLVVVALVVLLGLFLHVRQRRKEAGPPDSPGKLGRELCRIARLPWTARVLLWWVGRSTNLPVSCLLISSEAFETAVGLWAEVPTFGPARRWGRERLRRVQPLLFAA
jgi:hypothetical protein